MEKSIPPQEQTMLRSLKEIGLSKEFIRGLFGERWKEALHGLQMNEIEQYHSLLKRIDRDEA